MHAQMRRQLWCRDNRLISYNNITGNTIQNPNYRTIFHRPGELNHAYVCWFLYSKNNILSDKARDTDWPYFTNRLHPTNFIVYKLCDINGDITTITFSPSFLPQASGNFCYLVYFFWQVPDDFLKLISYIYYLKQIPGIPARKSTPAVQTSNTVIVFRRYSLPFFFQDNSPDITEGHIQCHQDTPGKASNTGLSARNRSYHFSPKNCIYHSTPANAQKQKLLPTLSFQHSHRIY